QSAALISLTLLQTELCMTRARWIILFCIALVIRAHPSAAVIPGGIYGCDESMSLSIDARQWPHTLGYHIVRGTAVYHGRIIPFASGVFLPPAFFHSTEPMPVLMALHNK